jgi:hypothetical protein
VGNHLRMTDRLQRSVGWAAGLRREDLAEPLVRTQHLFLRLPRPLAAHNEMVAPQQLTITRDFLLDTLECYVGAQRAPRMRNATGHWNINIAPTRHGVARQRRAQTPRMSLVRRRVTSPLPGGAVQVELAPPAVGEFRDTAANPAIAQRSPCRGGCALTAGLRVQGIHWRRGRRGVQHDPRFHGVGHCRSESHSTFSGSCSAALAMQRRCWPAETPVILSRTREAPRTPGSVTSTLQRGVISILRLHRMCPPFRDVTGSAI